MLRSAPLLFFILLCLPFTALHAETVNGDKVKAHRALSPAERERTNLPDALPQKSKNTQESRTAPITYAKVSKLNTRFKEGIDVSRYQGVIDWETVAAEGGVSYVYIKATEGAQLVDPYYYTNISEARRVGLSVGSYHFYRAHIGIDEQLANLTSVVRKVDQDLVPIIDIETTNGVPTAQFVADLRLFIDKVTDYYGVKPMLYTYQNFYNKHLVGEFQGYHRMIAKYQAEPPILREEVDYIMWQYTQTGRVPGIKGKVDRSCLMNNHSLTPLQM